LFFYKNKNQYLEHILLMKKIRGNKRRLNKIEQWRINSLEIDFNFLQKSNKDYIKFRIFPWNPVAMSLNNFPKPKGKIRKKILESFFDIYESWNIQLKELGKPYYLKIWLFEPDIYNSQVVCAINEKIEYYENIFLEVEIAKKISKSSLDKISNRINNYDWEYRIEENPIFENEFLRENFISEAAYLEEQKWLKNQLNKPHRIIDQKRNGIAEKIYLFESSDVWIGEK